MSLLGEIIGEVLFEGFFGDLLFNLFGKRKKQKLIFLVGFMGSGKTYLGRKIANKMSLPFCDLDQLIENEEGQSISEIFELKGEKYFRKVEAKQLRIVRKSEQNLVATGGGTPCFHRNMRWMNRYGITIYLKLEPQVLANRLKNEKSHRPLISTMDDEALLTFIENKLEERSKFYEQAQISLSSQQINDAKYMRNLVDRLKLMD